VISTSSAFFLQRQRTFNEYLWKAIFSSHQKAQIARMSAFIRPGTTVIDVGANVGFFARGFAREVGAGGVVLAFEPQSVPRSILTVASFFKRNQNLAILPFALGETSGAIPLAIPFKKKGNVGINLVQISDRSDLSERFEVKRELVALARLDDVLANYELPPVSMIKIDVEGAELGVLRGGQAVIEAQRPVVICEIDDRGSALGYENADVLDFFAARNYRASDLETGEALAPGTWARNTVFVPE